MQTYLKVFKSLFVLSYKSLFFIINVVSLQYWINKSKIWQLNISDCYS